MLKKQFWKKSGRYKKGDFFNITHHVIHFLKGKNFRNDDNVRIHRPTPRWVGNRKTFPIKLKVQRFDNTFESYEHLSDIYRKFGLK